MQSLAEVIAKPDELFFGEGLEHHREWLRRELPEQPGKNPRIDARILLKREREIMLGRKTRATQKQQVDEVEIQRSIRTAHQGADERTDITDDGDLECALGS